MENLEVETTLDTRHRTKTKNTTQVSYKDEQHGSHQTNWVEPRCSRKECSSCELVLVVNIAEIIHVLT
jgi:hypothetical protein